MHSVDGFHHPATALTQPVAASVSTAGTAAAGDGDGDDGGDGGDGDGDHAADAATSPMPPPPPPPPPRAAVIHCDSWDGTILCFGLCSTKLGTPVYPDCAFPSPIALFLSQSRTGKSHPHKPQEAGGEVGPLRKWVPNTLVVLPAATAHSRPDENIEPDADPDIPRWFCRATLRVAIAGKPRGKAAKRAAKKEFEADRLALALLVAETVWGDPVFATAARSCDPATPYPVSSPSLL